MYKYNVFVVQISPVDYGSSIQLTVLLEVKMKTALQIVAGIIILVGAYWRYSTQMDRVKDFLEEEDYTDVDVQRGYKNSMLAGFGERCTDDDEFYFTFSGVKNNKAYRGDLCCEVFFFVYESCDVLKTESINSSQ